MITTIKVLPAATAEASAKLPSANTYWVPDYSPELWRKMGALIANTPERTFGNDDEQAVAYMREAVRQHLGIELPAHFSGVIVSHPRNCRDRSISYRPTDYADCMVSADEE